MVETIQWEYRSVTAGSFWTRPKDEEMEALLNLLGQDGWEVISVVAQQGSNQLRIVAKRPLTAESRRRRSWPQ
jgi:hypothetical protein